ncbi:SDR family NAD(P)-dependent oxidoreductase [Patescibacteria group bacterium]|nr:SDR family NAD(P)-dependent oxidoreductase [Patescibacteria group bacterium]
MTKPSALQPKPLSQSNVVVTGGSRDIGGGIVLELSKAGAKVSAVFRSHADRAQKIIEEAKKSGAPEPLPIQADLTTNDGRKAVFNSWKKNFADNIDALVLCASGATIEINVDANMALVDKFLAIRKERIGKGEKLPLGTIIFLQSEPGHYQRVIDGVFNFLDYYRDKVGPAKRAGEDALRKRLQLMAGVGVRGIVVCPPEVEDTFNMKLFELQNKEARSKSRELSSKLGTKPFVTISQVAQKVRSLLENANIPNGHIQLFGNVSDGLTALSAIYGDEAIYVHTFEKIGEGRGIGRLIVNPKLWKRDEEPPFNTTPLDITKEHMRGHFRPDIASLFPGHKSIRTAAIALSQLFKQDEPVDPHKIYLEAYKSVKFRSPVLPGQTLTTKITLSGKTKDTVTGDAIQSVNGKESMDIRGMQVKKIKNAGEENALLLDQLIEASAQTVGMYVLASLENNDLLPLFHSTGEAKLLKTIQSGDNLLIKANNVKIIKTASMNIFSSDIEIYRAFTQITTQDGVIIPKVTREELVATVKALQGLLLPKAEILKKLS